MRPIHLRNAEGLLPTSGIFCLYLLCFKSVEGISLHFASGCLIGVGGRTGNSGEPHKKFVGFLRKRDGTQRMSWCAHSTGVSHSVLTLPPSCDKHQSKTALREGGVTLSPRSRYFSSWLMGRRIHVVS